MRRALNILAVVLAVAGWIGGLWSWQMWDVYYEDGFHRQLDRNAGRINIDNMHGVPLYTTDREHFWLNGLGEISMCVFVLACLIHRAQTRSEKSN